MIILGIDPGLAKTGFGLIKKEKEKIKLIDYGCLTTTASVKPGERLKKIYDEIKKIIKKYKPDLVVLEKLFFAKNAKTALKVGEARGIIILACYERKTPFIELTPLEVKLALTGYGRATKKQIQKIVQTLLKLKKIPQPDDAADAIALALCGPKFF